MALPNYDQLQAEALARLDPIYEENAKKLALLNQQRMQANDFTNQQVRDSGMQRFAELQQQAGMGYQDDATRANSAMQLDALRSGNQAQDEFSRRMGQMDQLDYNTALGQNTMNRTASRVGVYNDVMQQRAAAAEAARSGGGGGGGGGGYTPGGGDPTDAEVMARLSLMNKGQPKSQSAIAKMMDRYGHMQKGNSRELISVRDRVKKSGGSNIAALQALYGKKRLNLKKTKMVYENPRIMELLDQAAKDRAAYHVPMGATWEDAYNSILAERGL